VLGRGALDDKPPLETVNDESDCGMDTCSVAVGVKAVALGLIK
jgi:hypothetical protein